MCSYGNTKNKELEIYLGWYGCYFKLDEEIYSPQNNKILVDNSIDKQTMIDKIKTKYTYDDFIRVILECIENGREC